MESKELAHLSGKVECELRERAWELGEDVGKAVLKVYPFTYASKDHSHFMATSYIVTHLSQIMVLAAGLVPLNSEEGE